MLALASLWSPHSYISRLLWLHLTQKGIRAEKCLCSLLFNNSRKEMNTLLCLEHEISVERIVIMLEMRGGNLETMTFEEHKGLEIWIYDEPLNSLLKSYTQSPTLIWEERCVLQYTFISQYVSFQYTVYENVCMDMFTYKSICCVFCMKIALNQRAHGGFVFLRLTYFAEHNAFQSGVFYCKG